MGPRVFVCQQYRNERKNNKGLVRANTQCGKVVKYSRKESWIRKGALDEFQNKMERCT